MLETLSKAILFKLMGWSCKIEVPERKKCILCVAPHTSNTDFIIGELFCHATKKKANFLMKKSWFFWPLGILLKKMGGIPVNREKNTHLTDTIAKVAQQEPYFQIAITPEGTRSATNKWKKGFYFIALKANIPIQLYALDYAKKQIICIKEIMPNEQEYKEHLKIIMNYYKDVTGKHPEKFLLEKYD